MPHVDQATTSQMPTGASGLPPQSGNQQDALGERTSRRLGETIAEFHRKGLNRRREHDRTAEKYLLHIDGEGDSQYADLFYGQRLTITPDLSGSPRAQKNLLRPIVDNHVAYHTTMPLRVAAHAKPDREAREKALLDQAIANHIIREQNLNDTFARAMYLASPFGSCPVHAFWRDDPATDPYEPVWNDRGELMSQIAAQMGIPEEQVRMPSRGYIDAWVGDPWDTVFPPSATRTSIQAATYGRTLPTVLVRQAFGHVPGIDKLEGSDTMPSASRFQRISRLWEDSGRGIHGSPTLYGGEQDEELSALIYREIEPGIRPEWPDGRLSIIALQGTASTDRAEASGGTAHGEPFVLHDGPLPGGRKSFEMVYSMGRFDDVHGKPFVGDLDDLQVRLNQLETLLNEFIHRSTRPPLVDTGVTDIDTAFYEEDALLELDPELLAAGGATLPQFLELPAGHIQALEDAIERTEAAMWRIGGYQAASRGESKSGDPYAKVVALARADDTIHGPTNQRFRETVASYLQLCWSLFKENADVGWVVDMAGEEYTHLADPYIDRTMVSEKPPQYEVVSGFGATPEARGQQLMQLVTTRGADGRPLMETDEFRKAWPDASTFPEKDTSRMVRERRPRVINQKIRDLADQMTESRPQLQQLPMGSPQMQRIGQQIAMRIDDQYPILMDDDPMLHIDALSQVTQDETENPLARQIASARQRQYYVWVAQQRAQQAEAEETEGGEGEGESEARQPTASGGGGGADAARMAGSTAARQMM